MTRTTENTNSQTPTGTADQHRERLLRGVPVTERRLHVAGISSAILEGGEGPPVVLLHGPGESAVNWRWTIPNLATTHRVIAPDLPAHGASGAGDQPLDADRAIEWLDRLIEATCHEPPTIVGHVLGGAIAARFAAQRPDRLQRLVLVDSLGLGRFLPRPRFALTSSASWPAPASGATNVSWASARTTSTISVVTWATTGPPSSPTTWPWRAPTREVRRDACSARPAYAASPPMSSTASWCPPP
ncbi:MAG: alpha/beta fold hydrolase [Solirubrobacterales bacterium]